jgi:hypothetical protein
MPDQSHQRTAEFREQAAHAHGKGDHLTEYEHSKQTMEHANNSIGRSKTLIKNQSM